MLYTPHPNPLQRRGGLKVHSAIQSPLPAPPLKLRRHAVGEDLGEATNKASTKTPVFLVAGTSISFAITLFHMDSGTGLLCSVNLQPTGLLFSLTG